MGGSVGVLESIQKDRARTHTESAVLRLMVSHGWSIRSPTTDTPQGGVAVKIHQLWSGTEHGFNNSVRPRRLRLSQASALQYTPLLANDLILSKLGNALARSLPPLSTAATPDPRRAQPPYSRSVHTLHTLHLAAMARRSRPTAACPARAEGARLIARRALLRGRVGAHWTLEARVDTPMRLLADQSAPPGRIRNIKLLLATGDMHHQSVPLGVRGFEGWGETHRNFGETKMEGKDRVRRASGHTFGKANTSPPWFHQPWLFPVFSHALGSLLRSCKARELSQNILPPTVAKFRSNSSAHAASELPPRSPAPPPVVTVHVTLVKAAFGPLSGSIAHAEAQTFCTS